MFYGVEDGFGDVGRVASFAHGYLGKVIVLNVLYRLGAGHLTGGEVLDKETVLRIAPKRAVIIIPGTDTVHLYTERRQFQGKRLREAYAAELAAGVGKIGLGAAQTALGVYLDNVCVIIRICLRLDFHDVRGHFGAEEIGLVIDAGYKLEVFRRHGLQAAGTEHSRVGNKHIQGAEVADSLLHQVVQAIHVGHIGFNENGLVIPRNGVERIGRCLSHSFVKVCHYNVGTLPHQFAGDALAKTLGGAGYNDGFSLHTPLRMAGCHFSAIILHFPVVYKVYPGWLHPMHSAKAFRIPGHLYGVQEHFRNDAGTPGVISHSHQADTFDKKNFRRIALSGDVGFDGLLGSLGVRLQFKDLAFTIDYAVRSEGNPYLFRMGHSPVRESVGSYTKGFEASADAGEDLPDGGDHFRYAVRNRGFPFRQRGHLCLKRAHDAFVQAVNLFRGIGPHEDSVVLEENHLRLLSTGIFPLLQPVVHLFEKGVARVCIFNIKGLREEFCAKGSGVHAAHKTAHQRGMQVHHVGKVQAVVKGGFH